MLLNMRSCSDGSQELGLLLADLMVQMNRREPGVVRGLGPFDPEIRSGSGELSVSDSGMLETSDRGLVSRPVLSGFPVRYQRSHAALPPGLVAGNAARSPSNSTAAVLS